MHDEPPHLLIQIGLLVVETPKLCDPKELEK